MKRFILFILLRCFLDVVAIDNGSFYRISIAGNIPKTHANPADLFHERTERFIQSIRDAALQASKMIVFPEATFPSFALYGMHREVVKDYSFVLQEVEEKVNLCTDMRQKGRKALIRIACAASDYNIHVVMNVIEKTGPRNNHTYYNTNIVIDNTGEVIVKQRKRNLYAEKNIVADTTSNGNVVVFQTNFGIEFGLVFGTDLLLADTTQEIRKRNVQNILVLTAWVDDPCTSFMSRWLIFLHLSYNQQLNIIVADSSPSSATGIYLTEGMDLLHDNTVITRTLCSNPEVNRFQSHSYTLKDVLHTEILDLAVENVITSPFDICTDGLCLNFDLDRNAHHLMSLIVKKSCNVTFPWPVPSNENRLSEINVFLGGLIRKPRQYRHTFTAAKQNIKISVRNSGKTAVEPMAWDDKLIYHYNKHDAQSISVDIDFLFAGFFKIEMKAPEKQKPIEAGNIIIDNIDVYNFSMKSGCGDFRISLLLECIILYFLCRYIYSLFLSF